jgi:hypothetical protein
MNLRIYNLYSIKICTNYVNNDHYCVKQIVAIYRLLLQMKIK